MKTAAKLVVLVLGVAGGPLMGCSGSNRPRADTTGTGGEETGGSGGSTGGSSGAPGDTGGATGTGGSAGATGTGGDNGTGGASGDDAGVEPDASVEADAGLMADAGPPPDAAPPVPAPAPWVGKDIGAVGALAGYENTTAADNDSERITVYGGGAAGIGGKADAFRFVSRPITGDAELIGRVTSLSMVDPGTTGGLMIRESLDPDSAMVFVGPAGDGKTGGRVIARKAKGEDAVTTPIDPTMLLPDLKTSQWMRLVRVGSTIKVYAGTRLVSSNEMGSLGTITLTLKTTGPLYFGFASTSHSDAKLTSARLEDVSVNNLASDPVTKTWLTQTFGMSGGAALWNKGELSVTGLGQPWNGAPDKSRDFFQYAFVQPDTKSESLQFLVAGQSTTNPAGRVAAVYRQATDLNGLNRSNPTVALSLTQSQGLELAVRTANGEKYPLDVTDTKTGVKAPLWLRIDRWLTPVAGDPLGRMFTLVRTFYAPDNKGTPGKWTEVGLPTAFDAVGPADFATMGIAVGSYAPTQPNTAVISQIKYGTPPVTPPPPDGGAPDTGTTDASAGDGP
jgi:hypothetical protein